MEKRLPFQNAARKTEACSSILSIHLTTLVKKGAFGIPEPSETLSVYNPASDTRPAVCIIPAIVYDKEGFRIGYGKAFMTGIFLLSGTKIGLAYNDFIIDKVPRGKYDLSADVLITEKRNYCN